jgi:hypothetical protein
LKDYKIDPDVIEFVNDIIRDVLPLQYLNKICAVLKITFCEFHEDEAGKQYIPKQYG